MGAYAELLSRYIEDLRGAHRETLAWWDALFERELAIQAGDRAAAKLRIDLRWPCGPVSHPRVVAVFRQYYLECAALAREESEEENDDGGDAEEGAWGTDDDNDEVEGPWDEPRQLLIDYLWNVDPELGQFMKAFALIPIARGEAVD